MTKIGGFFRESVVKKVKEDLHNSESLFLVQYSKLSSVQMTLLRNRLREANSRLFVTKNTLMHKVLNDAKVEGLDAFIHGPTAIIFGPENISATAKILLKFAKENAALNIEGGLFHSRVLNPKEIEAISNLPAKEVLRAQVVMSLKAPLANLVFTLKGNLTKLVVALNQIKEKKQPQK